MGEEAAEVQAAALFAHAECPDNIPGPVLPVWAPPGTWCRFVAFKGGIDGEEDVVNGVLEVTLVCVRELLKGLLNCFLFFQQ